MSTNDSAPTILAYSSNTCDSDTQNSMTVLWDTKPDRGNYWWAHIKTPGTAWK